MPRDFLRISARVVAACGALLLAAAACAQSGTGALRGIVTDSSGSYVPGAKVTISGPAGNAAGAKEADTDGTGAYRFLNLAPGEYSVLASAPQLTQGSPAKITLTAGGAQVLNLRLSIETVVQTVNVQDDAAPTVNTDAANNASAVVLAGSDLEAVADNPEDMLADLQALAGPSAGPNGGSVYVDGFSGGELPPKESIREVRINSNPFSPEYDKLGFGRIEITTKPGADRFRGNLNYNLGSDVWNSRNPYSAAKAPLLLNEWENTISGPLGKRTSFALDANQNDVDNGAIINAVVLDPSLAASPLFQNYKMIQRRTRLNPRIDRQLSANNTISVRYQYTHGDLDGLGIGGFNLASRGFSNKYLLQTVQVMDTIVAGPAIFDLRFRYYRNSGRAIPDSGAAAVQVLGSFTSGGWNGGAAQDTFNGYESHNDASVVHGAHLFKFGVRIRDEFDNSVTPSNFNGTFTFSGGLAPELNANNQLILDATGQPVMTSIDSLEQYRRTLLFQAQGLSMAQVRALGGAPTQFSITTGTPTTNISQFDIGTYVGDDWRARPNLTLSYGLRYEVQTNISDHLDFAPRVGVAWAPGGNAKAAKAKTVFRAGFGIFYDRFAMGNSLNAARYNGIVQQQYVIDSPNFFPAVPVGAALAAISTPAAMVIQTIASDLHSPKMMQSALTVERQLPFNTTLAVTYSNSHGINILRTQDVNAPLLGTYTPANPAAALYPLGHAGAVFQAQSNARYNQNQMVVNVTSKINAAVSITASYVLNRAMSDSDRVDTIPSSPYSSVGEYGPASTDIRHRVSLTTSFNTKWNVRISPLMTLQTGAPFDITTGNDLYGTTLLNSRPGIATDLTRPGLVQTQYGLLDPNPIPGEQILGRNFGRGPGQFSLNLRIAKTIPLGPKVETKGQAAGSAAGWRGVFVSPPATRRYSLSISASIRNLLNYTNPGPIIGTITSPLFGQANQMAGTVNGEGFSENANNRRGELQLRFSF